MKEVQSLTTVEEIRAFVDPFRLDILRTYYNLGKPATVKQIADEMNEVPSKIHYHVKKLEKVNILKLHHTEEIKGIIAKYYLPTAKSYETKKKDDNDPELFLSEAQQMVENVMDTYKKKIFDIIKDKYVRICYQNLYLTDDELEEFTVMVESFIDSHNTKRDKANIKKHPVFFSIIGNKFRNNTSTISITEDQ
ncbi:helix-turn-helix transcriptional regulator [Clostridium sp. 'deep sea']|uniref:ArsR/SmtB family transcription factor n=1 Tax=Clostridium sp. 'deep sea' TaxID=2779445 RepID=UPI001896438B|nr:helix-turn-helix domain-containing protein [Clostridium sp. 'deep sea']QOR36125.1 helix-turn-helix transcriptional regulator [Clostridium sp. 'deep sea']